MEPLLTTVQVAEAFGFKVGTIQDWAEAKKIGYYKIGRKLMFTKKDLDTFMASRRVEARPRLRRVG